MLGYRNNSQHRSGYTVVLSKPRPPLVSLVPPSASTLPSSPSWRRRPPSSRARPVWAGGDWGRGWWPEQVLAPRPGPRHLITRQNVMQFHPWTVLKAGPLLG